jgi:pimeloyl-[acyl-carrier protein] methyl ester esterase
MSYQDIGQAPGAVVFLHGFAGHSGVWDLQLSALASKARMLAPDWPGHGASAWIPSTLDDLAQDTAELMRACGVSRAVIVASSMGALVALRLQELFPECAQALVLAGGLPRFTFCPDFPAGLDSRKIRKLAGQFDRDVGGVLAMFFRSLFTLQERSACGYDCIRDILRAEPLPRKEALLAFLDLLEVMDLRDSLRSCFCPVHFLLGESDPLCPLAVHSALRELVPGAQFRIYPDCGHFPFLTRSGEVNAVLEEVLSGFANGSGYV